MAKVKKCIVPMCLNSNLSTPKKLFLTVPSNLTRRSDWVTAIKNGCKENYPLNWTLTATNFYVVCEDHFNVCIRILQMCQIWSNQDDV